MMDQQKQSRKNLMGFWQMAHGLFRIPREDLMKRKEPFNIGRLMTILSVKHWESPSLRKLKARIVFRGDDIRDGDGNLESLTIVLAGCLAQEVAALFRTVCAHPSMQLYTPPVFQLLAQAHLPGTIPCNLQV